MCIFPPGSVAFDFQQAECSASIRVMANDSESLSADTISVSGAKPNVMCRTRKLRDVTLRHLFFAPMMPGTILSCDDETLPALRATR